MSSARVDVSGIDRDFNIAGHFKAPIRKINISIERYASRLRDIEIRRTEVSDVPT
jgi:hypothetical protein